MRSRFTLLLAALALPLIAAAQSSAAQRLLRPDARALPRLQQGLHRCSPRRRSLCASPHGGSGKQARAVIDGLEADVVTLALAYDIDVLADNGLLAPDWQKRLPHNASPYTSTIVFLVRKGNPKHIDDWADLARTGVEVITPTQDQRRCALELPGAAWGFALKQPGGNAESAKAFVKRIYANVKVLDSGARRHHHLRGARHRRRADRLGERGPAGRQELGPNKFDIVTPRRSILAEPPVAVVDKIAAKRGTTAQAQAYLQYLYSPAGQGDRGPPLLPPA